MFRLNGRDPRRQGHGARPPRWNLRWQPQAHALHVPCHEDASDSAREGNRHRVHQERGLQVFRLFLFNFFFPFYFFNVGDTE